MKHLLVPATTFHGCAVHLMTLTFEKDFLMVHSYQLLIAKFKGALKIKEDYGVSSKKQ